MYRHKHGLYTIYIYFWREKQKGRHIRMEEESFYNTSVIHCPIILELDHELIPKINLSTITEYELWSLPYALTIIMLELFFRNFIITRTMKRTTVCFMKCNLSAELL